MVVSHGLAVCFLGQNRMLSSLAAIALQRRLAPHFATRRLDV